MNDDHPSGEVPDRARRRSFTAAYGLGPPFTNVAVDAAQQPVGRRFTREVAVLIQQRRPYLRRSGVAEALAVQHREDLSWDDSAAGCTRSTCKIGAGRCGAGDCRCRR